jgi:hypothetical protein
MTKQNQLLVILVFCFLFLLSPQSYAQDLNNETDSILTSAEALFKAMQAKDYERIWGGLSQKSQDTIVLDTYNAIKAHGENNSQESVGKDFTGGGILAVAYWNVFLKKFDPVMILDQSKWEMETVKSDKAEIKITYKKAQNPAILKMFKEAGIWKVGLTESFWTRK